MKVFIASAYSTSLEKYLNLYESTIIHYLKTFMSVMLVV